MKPPKKKQKASHDAATVAPRAPAPFEGELPALPPEVLTSVLAHLTPAEAASAARVGQAWKAAFDALPQAYWFRHLRCLVSETRASDPWKGLFDPSKADWKYCTSWLGLPSSKADGVIATDPAGLFPLVANWREVYFNHRVAQELAGLLGAHFHVNMAHHNFNYNSTHFIPKVFLNPERFKGALDFVGQAAGDDDGDDDEEEEGNEDSKDDAQVEESQEGAREGGEEGDEEGEKVPPSRSDQIEKLYDSLPGINFEKSPKGKLKVALDLLNYHIRSLGGTHGTKDVKEVLLGGFLRFKGWWELLQTLTAEELEDVEFDDDAIERAVKRLVKAKDLNQRAKLFQSRAYPLGFAEGLFPTSFNSAAELNEAFIGGQRQVDEFLREAAQRFPGGQPAYIKINVDPCDWVICGVLTASEDFVGIMGWKEDR